ncbi:hypothetical protein MRX96_037284 [Rhipicephalus microplus]
MHTANLEIRSQGTQRPLNASEDRTKKGSTSVSERRTPVLLDKKKRSKRARQCACTHARRIVGQRKDARMTQMTPKWPTSSIQPRRAPLGKPEWALPQHETLVSGIVHYNARPGEEKRSEI